MWDTTHELPRMHNWFRNMLARAFHVLDTTYFRCVGKNLQQQLLHLGGIAAGNFHVFALGLMGRDMSVQLSEVSTVQARSMSLD
jgi:hypothetical protein